MQDEEIIRGLNLWMDRFIQHPEGFAREFQTVQQFLEEQAEGREPSYGEIGLAFMRSLLESANAPAPLAVPA